MSIGMPGGGGAVGQKGGGGEVCAGLTYWVGADVRANEYVVRPSGACRAGVNRLADEAWNASLASRFKLKRRVVFSHPPGLWSAGLSVPDSAIRSCVEALRPRRNLITIAKGSE